MITSANVETDEIYVPKEAMESPSLEILKSHLHMVLGNLLEQEGWTG